MNSSLAQLEAEALAIPHQLGLPPCPQVLVEVGRELRRETPDAQKVAHLITHDATSAAMILKTVNSSYYGLGSKARSVQQAIAHLGLNRTALLLAGLLLRNAFPTSNKAAMARFWNASTDLALTAALAARHIKAVDRGEAHTFGLFRDIGAAVLICQCEDYAAIAELDHRGPAEQRTHAEREHCGVDHATIGARLAKDWQLPEEMSEAILLHHAALLTESPRCPRSDVAMRFIALGSVCDRIVDVFEGIQPQDPHAHREALHVLRLSNAAFAELEAEALAMLDEASGKSVEPVARS